MIQLFEPPTWFCELLDKEELEHIKRGRDALHFNDAQVMEEGSKFMQDEIIEARMAYLVGFLRWS